MNMVGPFNYFELTKCAESLFNFSFIAVLFRFHSTSIEKHCTRCVDATWLTLFLSRKHVLEGRGRTSALIKLFTWSFSSKIYKHWYCTDIVLVSPDIALIFQINFFEIYDGDLQRLKIHRFLSLAVRFLENQSIASKN